MRLSDPSKRGKPHNRDGAAGEGKNAASFAENNLGQAQCHVGSNLVAVLSEDPSAFSGERQQHNDRDPGHYGGPDCENEQRRQEDRRPADNG